MTRRVPPHDLWIPAHDTLEIPEKAAPIALDLVQHINEGVQPTTFIVVQMTIPHCQR